LYADNVYLKGEVYAQSGYIGTKDAGWTINSTGISTDVAGRKIFMGTGGNASTYGDNDCWFLAESFTSSSNGVQARISLGDCFKVDSDTHEIKLSESANNYIHIKNTEPQLAIYSNGARALTFESTGPKFTLGDPDAANPNYLQYSGADFTLVSHGDQYFKITSGSTPTVTIGNPTGNSTNWMELTGGSFKLRNTDATGATTNPITMDNDGNIVIIGSFSIPQDAGSISDAQDAADDAQDTADDAQDAADDAQDDADDANGVISDMSADTIITPAEKLAAKLLYDTIVAEYAGILAQGIEQGTDTATATALYTTNYNALVAYIGNGETNVFGTMSTNTTIDRAIWDAEWKLYYSTRQALLNAIAADAETKADTAAAAALVADGKAVTADGKAVAAAAAALVADGKAVAAAAAALAANNALSDIADDTKVTPSEKVAALVLYTAASGEWDGIIARAVAQGVSSTAFGNDAADLYTYIETTTDLFNSMSTTTTIVQDDWRAVWAAYYSTRQILLNAIAADLESIADSAKIVADAAKSVADTAKSVADAAATHLTFLPVGHAAPSGTGYFSNTTHLGFHDATLGWTTYMGASGAFYLNGTGTNGLSWNGSTLTINGSLNVASTANNTSITANEINMYDGSGTATIKIHSTTDALGRVSGAAGLQPQLGIRLGQGGNDGGYLDCYSDDDHVSSIVPGTVYSSRGFSTRSASSGRLGWQIYGASESGAGSNDWIGFGALELPIGAVLWGATCAKEHDNGWMYTNNYHSFGIRFKHDPYNVTEAGGSVAMTMERRFTDSSWNTTRNDNPMSWRVIVWFYFPGNSTYDNAFD